MPVHRPALGIALAALLLGGLLVDAPGARAVGTWTPGAPMSMARSGYTATLLSEGRVLVAGGYEPARSTPSGIIPLAMAERYDPVANRWVAAAPMSTPRVRH